MAECFVAGLLETRPVPPGLRACGQPGTDDGRMTHHHLIKQQRIRKELPPARHEAALGDRRIMVRACWKHHQHVENRRIVIWRDDLPEAAFEFAREFGLEGWLDRYFPPAPAVSRGGRA